MRITPEEARALADLARAHFGPDCEVRLFGSRVDDAARGGDVDIHVAGADPARATLSAELGFEPEAPDAMGDVRVDVVVLARDAEPGPLDRIAMRRGVLLGEGARLAPPESDDLADAAALLSRNIATAREAARHLKEVRHALVPAAPPATGGEVVLDARAALVVDAFVWRYGRLARLVGRALPRGVLFALGQQEVARLSADQRWARLAGLGALRRGLDLHGAMAAADRLAGTHLADPAEQTRDLASANAHGADLLADLDDIEAYVAARLSPGGSA